MGRHCVSITLLLPGQSETQRSGIPSTSRVPASGLWLSRVGKEAGGMEDGELGWRKGFPEDMAQL